MRRRYDVACRVGGQTYKERGMQSRMKQWCRGEEVLRNKVFDLPHKENIAITREAITPIPDTVKLFREIL